MSTSGQFATYGATVKLRITHFVWCGLMMRTLMEPKLVMDRFHQSLAGGVHGRFENEQEQAARDEVQLQLHKRPTRSEGKGGKPLVNSNCADEEFRRRWCGKTSDVC